MFLFQPQPNTPAMPPPNPSNPSDGARPSRHGILTVKELAIQRRGEAAEPFALRGINLKIRSGEFMTLTGISGCGKSTLLLALAGLLPIEAGTVELDGLPQEQFSPPNWHLLIGLAQAEPRMVEGSVGDNLLLAWRFHHGKALPQPSRETLQQELKALGLENLNLDENAARLSTGQRERVALLRHCLPRPGFLLLDEPTANLDKGSAKKVWEWLRYFQLETGAGILCATHETPPFPVSQGWRLNHDGLVEAREGADGGD